MAKPSFRVYAVGGCVRDKLLRAAGIDAHTGDHDWVVVGATAQDLLDRGFTPVGADFPVFLHPETHEEYALARTERKTAAGYHGFVFHASPNVTLQDDLRRRDLTMNAMAQDEEGHIIDPYGGRQDIENRLFRHVSPAFSEDPVRILRLARFAARLPMFRVAAPTMQLLRSMVDKGEADALVPERVWAELSRGIMEKTPSRMFDVLQECGYWPRAFPQIPLASPILVHLDAAARENSPLAVRFCLLFANCDAATAKKALTALRATNEVIELCALFCRLHKMLPQITTPEAAARLFEQADCLRRKERFQEFLMAAHLCDGEDYRHLLQMSLCWMQVDAGAIARKQTNPRNIASAIAQARLEALQIHWRVT